MPVVERPAKHSSTLSYPLLRPAFSIELLIVTCPVRLLPVNGQLPGLVFFPASI